MKPTIEVQQDESGKTRTISGTRDAQVISISLRNQAVNETDLISTGEKAELVIDVRVNTDIETLVFGYGIKDRLGQVMYGTNTWHTKQMMKNVQQGDEFKFRVKFPANLGAGTYSVQTALCDSDTHLINNYEWQDRALLFTVANVDKTFFSGCNWIEPQIIVEKTA